MKEKYLEKGENFNLGVYLKGIEKKQRLGERKRRKE